MDLPRTDALGEHGQQSYAVTVHSPQIRFTQRLCRQRRLVLGYVELVQQIKAKNTSHRYRQKQVVVGRPQRPRPPPRRLHFLDGIHFSPQLRQGLRARRRCTPR